MVTITERAAAKVKEIADAENLHGQGLRLRVIGGGCSGFSYDLYFEDSPTDMDEEFEARGVKLYVDPLSFQYLEGTEIDYVEELHASGFKFNNPKASGTCGCGSSFSALDAPEEARRSGIIVRRCRSRRAQAPARLVPETWPDRGLTCCRLASLRESTHARRRGLTS